MLVDVVDKRAYLGLGELRVCADALTLCSHLIIYQRGEQEDGDTVKNLIVLYALCKVVTVHLRHFDIGDKAGHLIEDISAEIFVTVDIIPRVLAVIERDNILVARIAERALD